MLPHALPQRISHHPWSCKWVDSLHNISCSDLASCIQAEQEAETFPQTFQSSSYCISPSIMESLHERGTEVNYKEL